MALKKRPGGFTLSEMMVTIALIGVVAMIAPRIFISVTQYFRMNQARYEIQRDAKSVMLIINRNLRQASSSSVTVTQEAGQPPYSRLNFTKYTDGVSNRAMSFYQSGNKLYEVDRGVTRLLCQNLRYIAFSYPRTDNGDILSMSLTLEKATYQGRSKALHLAVEKVRLMND